MVTRQELHDLLDHIPEQGWVAARHYLQALREANGDPLLAQLLLAPEDDEPSTPEEDAAVAEAREQYRRGEWVSGDELKRRLLG